MYTVLIPDIKPEGTYYLCNGYGGVATVKGSDIQIHGHFVGDDFQIHCTYRDCDNIYPIKEVKVKHGTLLTRAPVISRALWLSWHNHATNEDVSAPVDDDLSLLHGGVFVCKDYEPKCITSATDDELILPYNSYVYCALDGRFRCELDSGLHANDQVYKHSEDVKFYCRCHAVSDKSMAQHVRLTDEQLSEVNARVKNLMDYCNEQGIALGYDYDYGRVVAYKSNDLPEGYEAYINDCTNGDAQSMTVPQSGLRRLDLSLGYISCDQGWCVQLDYNEQKEGE